MGLVQPYLVLQLIVPDEARVAIDMSVMDSSGGRRRIQMSTSQREVAVTPLNARVPLGAITGEVSSHAFQRVLTVSIVHTYTCINFFPTVGKFMY